MSDLDLSSSDDYVPEEDEDSDEHHIGSRSRGRGGKAGRRRGRPPKSTQDAEGGDDSGPEESGYTTGGYTTGDDDDDYVEGGGLGHDLLTGVLDPLALLHELESGAGEAHTLLRSKQRAQARARRERITAQEEEEEEEGEGEGGGEEEGDEEGGEEEEAGGEGGADGMEEDGAEEGQQQEAGPSSRASAWRARRQQQQAAAGAGGGEGEGAFGADYDDIMEYQKLLKDPLAAQLGLIDRKDIERSRGGRGRGRGRILSQKGANRRARRKRARGKGSGNQLPEEVTKQLGSANLLYATGQFKEAADILMSVIKACPNLADPYHTLGLLHEAMGSGRKALDFYMIAAHLTPKDVALWKRLAALSTEVGYLRQAIYCLSKAIAHTPGRADADARWDRAVLHAELGELGKALRQLREVSALRPGDPEVPKMLARLHHRMDSPQAAMEVLEKHLEEHPDSADLTHVNMLAELYMGTGAFAQTHALIERAAEQLPPGEELPMDLVAKDGTCLANLGRMEEALKVLAPLMPQKGRPTQAGAAAPGEEEEGAQGPPVSLYPDLQLDVGMSLAAMGQHAAALTFLSALLDIPEFAGDPALWTRLLACHRALGDTQAAIALYERVLSEQGLEVGNTHYPETALTLCELYVEGGQQDKARTLLARLDHELVAEGTNRGGSSSASAGQPSGDQATEAGPEDVMMAAAAPPEGAQGEAEDMEVGEAQAQQSGGSQPGGPKTQGVPSPLLMRKNKLHLALGQRREYIDTLLPLVKGALSRLARDSQAVKNPGLPRSLVRAIQRRRMLERKGKGAVSAINDGSMFQSGGKRDRRKASVRAEDEAAEAYLAALSQGEESDAEAALSTVSQNKQSRTAALRAMFTDDEGIAAFVALCRSMVVEGRAEEAASLASRAADLCAQAARWFPRRRRDMLLLLLVDMQCAAGNLEKASAPLKGLIARWPASCRAWSRYSRVTAMSGNISLRKFSALTNAARRKHPESVPAMVMQGHAHTQAGQYADALSEYFQAYRFWPCEPLLLLCIGVSFLSLAVHDRRVHDRNKAVLMGFAFLQVYERQRGNLHESSYNIARAAHHLRLLNIAHEYYQRCLATAPSAPGGGANNSAGTSGSAGGISSSDRVHAHGGAAEGMGGTAANGLPGGATQEGQTTNQGKVVADEQVPPASRDLTREAAYNLALLYQQSGAPALVRQVYAKYLTIV